MQFFDIFIYFATMIGIFGILALGLNLQYGLTGLVNFGHVAFYAIGGYTAALATIAGAPFVVSLLLAGIVAAFAGLLIALPTARLSTSYWAITTLGIAEIVRMVALNEEWLTKGSFGLDAITPPWLDLVPTAAYSAFYMALTWAVVGAVLIVLILIWNSPFGRALKAIREDEELATSLGKPVFLLKLKAMALGAMFAGLAGGLYAHYITFISPDDFTPVITMIVWAMVIIGGKGNLVGSIFGTVVIVGFYNSTRFLKDYLPFEAETVANLRMLVIGLLIIGVVLFRPQGVIAERKRIYKS